MADIKIKLHETPTEEGASDNFVEYSEKARIRRCRATPIDMNAHLSHVKKALKNSLEVGPENTATMAEVGEKSKLR